MGHLYTNDHIWLLLEGTTVRCGISAFAAEQLGTITFVELPETGSVVNAGDVMCGVESIKVASDIITPCGGTIVAINSVLEESPELVNSSPEEKGWMVELEIDNIASLDALMSREEYTAFLEKQK